MRRTWRDQSGRFAVRLGGGLTLMAVAGRSALVEASVFDAANVEFLLVDFDRLQMLKNVRRHFVRQFDQREGLLNVDVGNVFRVDAGFFHQHFFEYFRTDLMPASDVEAIAHQFNRLRNRLPNGGLALCGGRRKRDGRALILQHPQQRRRAIG